IVIIDSQMNYRGKLDTYGPQSGPKKVLDIMSPAHYNSHNLRKQTVEAEIKIIRALTGSRGIEKPAGRRLLNGPLRAR
ncbi:hypothetical protein, partial [Dialister succinatiphilus]|uniref:hypothetical protein n=1 Tax=Dialister succinatiphilus TaxID=487173 RepID=UPI00402698AA